MTVPSSSRIPDLRCMKAYLINAFAQEIEAKPALHQEHCQTVSWSLEKAYVRAKIPPDERLRSRLI